MNSREFLIETIHDKLDLLHAHSRAYHGEDASGSDEMPAVKRTLQPQDPPAPPDSL